jgi:hypothetical protein
MINYHRNKSINKVINYTRGNEVKLIATDFTKLLCELSKIYSDKLFFWCEASLANELNLDSMPEIFHHNKEFANAVVEVLQDKNLNKNLGSNARQSFLANFSSVIIAKKNSDFYKKIIERNINNGN